MSARTHDLVIRGGTVVSPLDARRVDVAVDGERIAAIGENLVGERIVDASGKLVFPGVIDAHTHMALPVAGIRSSDDFFTGSVAAAFGGVTAIIDFTVGSRDTTIPEDIEHRMADLSIAVIDVALHAEVVGWAPEDRWQFEEAVRKGVTSFKFYTAYEASGRRTHPAEMRRAFEVLGDLECVALVHCEDEELIRSILKDLTPRQMEDMATLAHARPDLCEQTAISQVAHIARDTGCHAHIVHVSSALGLSAVQEARKHGAPLTAETCPQYLTLTADCYDRMDGHLFAASPALRTLADQQELWEGLRDRGLDFVATDHCPFTKSQKLWRGSFVELPYGLPGVETLLPLLFTEGVNRGLLSITDLPRLLSARPAACHGLDHRKGRLEVGMDADIVVFDPQLQWEIAAHDLHMNTDFSPYEGWIMDGKAVATIARGEVIVEDGDFLGHRGRGQYVFRSTG